MKKALIIFFIFFCGTSALVTVDRLCRETTGIGGQLELSMKRINPTQVEFTFLGWSKDWDL